jgi:hypothetical protein
MVQARLFEPFYELSEPIAECIALCYIHKVFVSEKALKTEGRGYLKRFGACLVMFMLLAIVWGVLAWPLPMHFATGIPSSAHNVEKDGVRTMIAGDHLQLLYQFWLFEDMVTGPTPLFYNLYEFNAGDDAARRENSSYFMPFPLFYMTGSWLSRAFGWNLALCLSLFLTYVFTVCLVGRYAEGRWTARLVALAAVMMPFRWIALMGGSPSGFAMMWVSLLLYGLDVAVRDEKAWGGLVAGVCIFVSFLSDTHVFFFGVLVTPFWCLFAFLARSEFEWKKGRSYVRLVGALWPAALLLIVTMVLMNIVRGDIEGASGGGQRALGEVALFCPRPSGLLSWRARGVDSHVYIGWVPLITVGSGWLAGLFLLRRVSGSARRRWWLLTLLVAGLAGMVVLALGPYGPLDGRLFLWARRLVPPYSMVRQTAKIFCLVPTVLAVAMGLAVSCWHAAPRLRAGLTAGLLAALLLEYGLQFSPTVCEIDEEQGAYAAVAREAEERGVLPRAMAVPLWPGDTHWSSLYQHYASLYRIRMVNGYRPTVPQTYIDDVFARFDSVNMGWLSDDQLDELLARGVDYVLLHEDAFPEKVSCYPVGFTLQRLLAHPRLAFLSQDATVWAFRIVDRSEQPSGVFPPPPTYAPARRWEFEHTHGEGAVRVQDDTASGGACMKLAPGAYMHCRATATVPVENQRWRVRVRGAGLLRAEVYQGESIVQTFTSRNASTSWQWMDVPLHPADGYEVFSLRLELLEGEVALDTLFLSAGSWSGHIEAPVFLPAQMFFHAGYSDFATGDVVLRQAYDPAAGIFYGPGLPVDPGGYEVQMRYVSSAPVGTALGSLRVQNGVGLDQQVPVTAGSEAICRIAVEENVPLRVVFDFARADDIRIAGVSLKKVE